MGVQDWLSDENTVFVFDHKEKTIEDDESDKKLQRVLDNTTLLIGHNLQYDLQWFGHVDLSMMVRYLTPVGEYILQRGQKSQLI